MKGKWIVHSREEQLRVERTSGLVILKNNGNASRRVLEKLIDPNETHHASLADPLVTAN
jgi:hypothetical protein